MQHQACAWPHHHRCDRIRPQSSWMDFTWLSICASAISLAPRVLCELSGHHWSFEKCPQRGSATRRLVVILHNQAAGHNMIIIITWCVMHFFISNTAYMCLGLALTTPRRCTPTPNPPLPFPDRPGCNGTNWAGHHKGTVAYLLWQDHPIPIQHLQNMVGKCCPSISNKVWPITTAHLQTRQ